MFNDRDLDNSSIEIYVTFCTYLRGLSIFALTYFKKAIKKKKGIQNYTNDHLASLKKH